MSIECIKEGSVVDSAAVTDVSVLCAGGGVRVRVSLAAYWRAVPAGAVPVLLSPYLQPQQLESDRHLFLRKSLSLNHNL